MWEVAHEDPLDAQVLNIHQDVLSDWSFRLIIIHPPKAISQCAS